MESSTDKSKLISDLLRKPAFKYRLPYNKAKVPPKSLEQCIIKQPKNFSEESEEMRQIITCKPIFRNNPFKPLTLKRIEKEPNTVVTLPLTRPKENTTSSFSWNTPSLKRQSIVTVQRSYQQYDIIKKERKMKAKRKIEKIFTPLPLSVHYVPEPITLGEGEIISVKFPKKFIAPRIKKNHSQKLSAADIIWLKDVHGNINGFPLYNEEQLLKWDIESSLDRSDFDFDDDTPTTVAQAKYAQEQIQKAIEFVVQMYQ